MSNQHNATGRNHHPSKAERQQALALANQGNGRSHLSTVKEEKKAKAPPKTDPATRGNITRERWGKIMKKRPAGSRQYDPKDIKPLPESTVIKCTMAGPQKKGWSTARYELYKFEGLVDATTTIGEYIQRVTARGGENFTKAKAIADIAWDINHGFIELVVAKSGEEEPGPMTEQETEAKGEHSEAA